MGQVTLAGSDFNTLLAVYTGTVVSALTRVAFNDNCTTSTPTSCTTFRVLPGTTYSIQVDGKVDFGVVAIDVTFGWAVPSNDAFSAAVTTFPANSTTLGATLETGEPYQGTGASGSVWFRYSAPASTKIASVSCGTIREVEEACCLGCGRTAYSCSRACWGCS